MLNFIVLMPSGHAANNIWDVESFTHSNGNNGIRVLTYDKSKVLFEFSPRGEDIDSEDSIAPDAILINSKAFSISGRRFLLVQWQQGVRAQAIAIFDPEKSENQLLYQKVSDSSIEASVQEEELIIY